MNVSDNDPRVRLKSLMFDHSMDSHTLKIFRCVKARSNSIYMHVLYSQYEKKMIKYDYEIMNEMRIR